MVKSKLIAILKSLNKRELSQFKEFVNSPFFNKSRYIKRLLEELCLHYPFNADAEIQKEKLYFRVYDRESYNEGKFKNLVSDLYELSEKFLVYNSMNENSIDFKKDLIKILRERNIEKVFQSIVNEAEKELLSVKLKDRGYFYRKWMIEQEVNLFFSERDRMKYGKNLQSEFDNFVNYSLLILLDFYVRLTNEGGYSNIKYLHTLQNEVIDLFKNHGSFDEPLLEMYFNALMLRLTFEEKYFLRLKELKTQFYNLLSETDLYIINSNLQSFYIVHGNRGVTGYGKDYFELQKESLKDYNHRNTMPYILFLNIVKTGANLWEFGWLEGFISDFKVTLSKKYKDAVVDFSFAYIFYKQGNFDKSLEILAKIHTETMQINLEIKKLTCIIYYENGSDESAFLMIDSFRHFINSEKIAPPSLKDLLLGFLKFFNELLKLRINKDAFGAGLLLKKIEEHSYVSNKTWLMEKVKELL